MRRGRLLNVFETPLASFAERLSAAGVRRAAIFPKPGGGYASTTPAANVIRDTLENAPQRLKPEALFLELGEPLPMAPASLHLAVVHSSVRGPATGGVHSFSADYSIGDTLRCVLRAARSATTAAALARAPAGGCASAVVVCAPPPALAAAAAPGAAAATTTPETRGVLFAEHGAFVSSLAGLLHVWADQGCSRGDFAVLAAGCPYALGGADAVEPLAQLVAAGALAAAVAAVPAAFPDRPAAGGGAEAALAGLKVGVLGVGKVGRAMVAALQGVAGLNWILAAEAGRQEVDAARRRYASSDRVSVLRVGSPESPFLLEAEVDALFLCGHADILHSESVGLLSPQCRLIVAAGPAAATSNDLRAVANHGAVLVPDTIVTMGAAMHAAALAAGVGVTGAGVGRAEASSDPRVAALFEPGTPGSIPETVGVVLGNSRDGRVPWEVAAAMATPRETLPHPVWGARGRDVLTNALLSDGWAADRSVSAPAAPPAPAPAG